MRLVAFAYACEPASGSEPGAGWQWAQLLAEIGETWVITRANNRHAIESGLQLVPDDGRLHFVFVDPPHRLTRWKKGTRGLRLYYLWWQLAALRRARALHRDIGFDVAWHLTLANAWLGSLAPLVGTRFIYGPVGGGVAMPWRLVTTLGLRGALYEVVRGAARAIGRYCNPVARLAWRRAEIVLVQNHDTRAWLPRKHRGKAVVFSNVLLEGIGDGRRVPRHGATTALYAGRLLPWKGVALALRAVALLPSWNLIVCGSGPDEPRLKALSHAMGIDERVEFKGQLGREAVFDLMRASDVFLFPSLHDEAGWVVAEARASGLPVVCLDRGGPPLLGGTPVPPGRPGPTVRALAGALRHAVAYPAVPSTSFSFAARAQELVALLSTELHAAG